MSVINKSSITLGVMLAISACKHGAALDSKTNEAEKIKPAIEAATCGPLSAWAEITLDANNQPAFGASGGGGATPSGGCMSNINLVAQGNIDLGGFPPGNVAIQLKLDPAVTAAGYHFPTSIWNAIGIAIVPENSITTPIPQFGQEYWPSTEFGPPSFSGNGTIINFVDYENPEIVYEYGINLIAPNNATILMDPRIKNGGIGHK